jgi:hypothetical protein
MNKIVQYHKDESLEWALLLNGDLWERAAYFQSTGGYFKSKEWSDWRKVRFPFLDTPDTPTKS